MPQAATLTDDYQSDDQLLDRARRGDQQAFRLLVERYEGKVAATVISMLGRGPEADDVGQETFIRFYRSMDKFRGDSSVGTYLTRIAINQSLKTLKRRQSWTKRFVSSDDDSSDRVYFDSQPDGNEEIARKEMQEIVQKSLLLLKIDQRAVVVLRMIEGYSTRETAQLLGIAEGTVMSRLSRGLATLELKLKGYFR